MAKSIPYYLERRRQLQQLALVAFACGLFTITWDRIAVFDLGGFTFRLSQGSFLGAFFLLFFLQARPLLNMVRVLSNGFALSFLALATFFLISSPRSYFPSKSALYSVWLLFNLGTMWFCGQLLPVESGRRWLVRAITLSLILNCVVILIDQWAFRYGYLDGLIGFNQFSISGSGISRPHAFSYEPSYVALNMSLSLGFLLPYLMQKGAHFWLLYALGTIGLVATTSRSGLLGFVMIGAVFLGLLSLRNRRIPLRFLAAAFALMIAAVCYSMGAAEHSQRQKLISTLVTSLKNGTDGSLNARWRTNLLAPELAAESNWLGVGLGASFRYTMDHKQTLDTSYVPQSERISNGAEIIPSTWGQLLAEGGIIAVLLFLTAGVFLIVQLWRAWAVTNNTLVLAALSSAIVWFFAMTFWIGNIARGDIWIWYSIWSFTALAAKKQASGLYLSTKAN